MTNNNTIDRLQQKIRQLETELSDANLKLKDRGIELEASEGLLHLAMEDMRRIYEDLIKSQGQLMQSDKLATIGLLAAGIAHEINNPLAAVKMALSLLEAQSKDMITKIESSALTQDDEVKLILKNMQEYANQGLRCVDSMARIVTDIRTFSRSDKGQRTLANVNHVIDSVIHVVWNAVKNKVRIEKKYGQLPEISCNTQQLGQVFLNLLVNASQAMDKNHQGAVTVHTFVDGKNICVKISDTGCGMPQEVMDRIFEAFFTTKDAEEGTGLGLSITKDIVKKHDGEISVDSVVGKGTTFTILLPL